MDNEAMEKTMILGAEIMFAWLNLWRQYRVGPWA